MNQLDHPIVPPSTHWNRRPVGVGVKLATKANFLNQHIITGKALWKWVWLFLFFFFFPLSLSLKVAFEYTLDVDYESNIFGANETLFWPMRYDQKLK